MKFPFHFIFGLLAVVFMVGFLSLSYFQSNSYNSAEAAVPDVGQIEPVAGGGFGPAVCDRIIPIGEPLEKTVDLLATIYEANQNTAYDVDLASKTLSSIYTQLNENQKEVCDWKKCSPNFANLGPNFAIELDAVVKKWKVGGQVPLPVDEECTGSPCPILGSPEDEKLAAVLAESVKNTKVDEKKEEFTKLTPIGTLIGLEWIIERQAKVVQDLFDETNPTEVVTEDLAQMIPINNDPSQGYISDAGTKISKTAMIKRQTSRAAAMIKDCTLSETEKKMFLSGRLGDKYPMTCQAALENGQYWPLAWSEFCKSECAANQAGSDKCIECLRKPRFFIDLKKASILARLNYKIYNQCATKTVQDPETKEKRTVGVCYDPQSGDWKLSGDCMECLCTDMKVTSPDVTGMGNDVIEPVRMSDNECLAWLCGGNAHNWTCCHQAPIEFSGDMDPWGGPALEYSETPVPLKPEGAPPTETTGVPVKATYYCPPSDCKGNCVAAAVRKAGMNTGEGDMGAVFGIVAVDYINNADILAKLKNPDKNNPIVKEMMDHRGRVAVADIQPGSRIKITTLWKGNEDISDKFREFVPEDGSGKVDLLSQEFCACDRIGQLCKDACVNNLCTPVTRTANPQTGKTKVPCVVIKDQLGDEHSLVSWVDFWLPGLAKDSANKLFSQVDNVSFDVWYDKDDNCCKNYRKDKPVCKSSCPGGRTPVAGW